MAEASTRFAHRELRSQAYFCLSHRLLTMDESDPGEVDAAANSATDERAAEVAAAVGAVADRFWDDIVNVDRAPNN